MIVLLFLRVSDMYISVRYWTLCISVSMRSR